MSLMAKTSDVYEAALRNFTEPLQLPNAAERWGLSTWPFSLIETILIVAVVRVNGSQFERVMLAAAALIYVRVAWTSLHLRVDNERSEHQALIRFLTIARLTNDPNTPKHAAIYTRVWAEGSYKVIFYGVRLYFLALDAAIALWFLITALLA